MSNANNIKQGKLHRSMTFTEKAWAVCARVPKGKVTTYGAIARKLGKPQGARAVGQAMNRNPYSPDVPCHRVVGSDGKLTGFATGLPKKRRLLEAEGVTILRDRVDRACIVDL
jgi:methylated-DNA-[protein]-cysteine S-methyltransferase